MLTSNPFAELSASIPPAVMQTYIVVMIILVAGDPDIRFLAPRKLTGTAIIMAREVAISAINRVLSTL